MLITKNWEPISPDERKAYTLDFTAYLDPTDSLVTAVWTAETYQGDDDHPENILSGVPNTSDGMTAHFVSNATAGVIYRLAATCTTVLGETLQLVGQLACIDSM